jgi:DNA-directed RNA polymerase subunit RPC12/RpoP
MTADKFLFPEDRQRELRRQEWLRKSRTYGSEEFEQAYAIYICTSKWKKLCQQIKERANGRCERCGPHEISLPPFQVHHLTYERFMNELLTDLQYVCLHCHGIADRERERRNKRAYEEAGEDARDAAGMNTYFTKKYGENWPDLIDMASAYEEWSDWLQDRQEDRDY